MHIRNTHLVDFHYTHFNDIWRNRIPGSLYHLTSSSVRLDKANVRESSPQAWPWLAVTSFCSGYFFANHQRFARQRGLCALYLHGERITSVSDCCRCFLHQRYMYNCDTFTEHQATSFFQQKDVKKERLPEVTWIKW